MPKSIEQHLEDARHTSIDRTRICLPDKACWIRDNILDVCRLEDL